MAQPYSLVQGGFLRIGIRSSLVRGGPENCQTVKYRGAPENWHSLKTILLRRGGVCNLHASISRERKSCVATALHKLQKRC